MSFAANSYSLLLVDPCSTMGTLTFSEPAKFSGMKESLRFAVRNLRYVVLPIRTNFKRQQCPYLFIKVSLFFPPHRVDARSYSNMYKIKLLIKPNIMHIVFI